MKYLIKQSDLNLKDDYKNLKYIAKHKYYIIGPGRQLGLSYGQLLKHDLSKLTPTEWGPYAQHWFGKKTKEGEKAYATARAHHFANNPSHFDRGPRKYKLEAVADWYSAAKTQASDPSNFPDFKTWYMSNRENFITHPTKPISSNVDSFIRKKLR